MSKYVKEMMMDQLKSDLDGSRSVLIVDLKGLDAIAEHGLRRDLRKKSIKIRALKNTLARRVFSEMGMDGLSQFLAGPSVIAGVHGQTPALGDLVSGDLKWSTDFRSVYATLLDRWLKLPSAGVFEGHFDTLPILKS